MQITGAIRKIFETQTFPSGFVKREIVITTKEQFPQELKVEWLKDSVSKIDGLNVGDEVEADVNLRGSEYQGKYFVQLVGWKISVVGKSTIPEYIPAQADRPTPPTQAESDDSDLPF